MSQLPINFLGTKTAFYIFLITGFFYSCTKQENCPRYFQIPFSVNPIQSEYHVGHTLAVISKFYKRVTAFNSESKEIGNFDMKGIK